MLLPSAVLRQDSAVYMGKYAEKLYTRGIHANMDKQGETL